MNLKSIDVIRHPATPMGADFGLFKFGHPTAAMAVSGNRVNRTSLSDCRNGSPRLNGVTGSPMRTIFALNGPICRINSGGSRAAIVLLTGLNSLSFSPFRGVSINARCRYPCYRDATAHQDQGYRHLAKKG